MIKYIIAFIFSITIFIGDFGYRHHEFCKKLVKEQSERRLQVSKLSFENCMSYAKDASWCILLNMKSVKFQKIVDHEELKNAYCHP